MFTEVTISREDLLKAIDMAADSQSCPADTNKENSSLNTDAFDQSTELIIKCGQSCSGAFKAYDYQVRYNLRRYIWRLIQQSMIKHVRTYL